MCGIFRRCKFEEDFKCTLGNIPNVVLSWKLKKDEDSVWQWSTSYTHAENHKNAFIIVEKCIHCQKERYKIIDDDCDYKLNFDFIKYKIKELKEKELHKMLNGPNPYEDEHKHILEENNRLKKENENMLQKYNNLLQLLTHAYHLAPKRIKAEYKKLGLVVNEQ